MDFIHLIKIIPGPCSSLFVGCSFKVQSRCSSRISQNSPFNHDWYDGDYTYTSVTSCATYCALMGTHVCEFMRAETFTKQMIIFVLVNGHGNTHIWIMTNLRRICLNTSKSIQHWHTLLDAVVLTKRISEMAGKIFARYSETY